MAKSDRTSLFLMIFAIVIIQLSSLPLSHCAKQPVGVARKEDIPYIKCQVCEKLASQLYHQVQAKQAEISPKKVLLLSGLRFKFFNCYVNPTMAYQQFRFQVMNEFCSVFLIGFQCFLVL